MSSYLNVYFLINIASFQGEIISFENVSEKQAYYKKRFSNFRFISENIYIYFQYTLRMSFIIDGICTKGLYLMSQNLMLSNVMQQNTPQFCQFSRLFRNVV